MPPDRSAVRVADAQRVVDVLVGVEAVQHLDVERIVEQNGRPYPQKPNRRSLWMCATRLLPAKSTPLDHDGARHQLPTPVPHGDRQMASTVLLRHPPVDRREQPLQAEPTVARFDRQ